MIVKSSQEAWGPSAGEPLRQTLAVLGRAGVVPAAGALLGRSGADAAALLKAAILAEVPAFRVSGNPRLLPQLERHIGAHIAELARLFAGGEPGDLAFVGAEARTLAEEHFPLEAFLHAYRAGHRVLSRWLREAAIATGPAPLDAAVSAVADFAIEYTNAISALATSAYVAEARRLAEAEGDLRTELLSLLLTGYDESDLRVAEILKRTGYLEQRQTYCVVVVRAVQAAEMERHPRVERIVTALTDTLAETPFRLLAGIRNQTVVGVVSDKRRQSGWTAPAADLADRLLPRLTGLGPAVLTGLSADHPSTAFIPKALQEAMIALGLASVARRVVRFSDLSIRDLVIHHGAPSVERAPPAWVGTLAAADRKAEGALVATLRALADADMNVQEAARRLGRHPNTVYTRLARIRDLTGRDGQRYHDLSELLLAADCWRA
jgi:hypothetical protein